MERGDLVKYFNKRKPAGGITLLFLGMLFFLVGVLGDAGLGCVLIGASMFAGGCYIISKSNIYQSDASVDAFCGNLAQDFFAFKKKIVDSYKGTIEDELLFSEYNFENIFSARLARKGKDGIWRSSVVEMTCAFFLSDMICYYNKKVSLITDEKFEMQKEIPVLDIQMVSMEESNQNVAVVITISGNEKLYFKYRDRERATKLYERVKNKFNQL